MQIYLVDKAGLIVSSQKTAAQDVLEASIKKKPLTSILKMGALHQWRRRTSRKPLPVQNNVHSIW
jgi:hypothetical protein